MQCERSHGLQSSGSIPQLLLVPIDGSRFHEHDAGRDVVVGGRIRDDAESAFTMNG